MKRVFALTLALALLAGCGGRTEPAGPDQGAEAPPSPAALSAPAGDLMSGVTSQEPGEKTAFTDAGAAAVTGLGLGLLQNVQGENALVSPLSVIEALAMTANGAAGQTLSQMESVLGGSMDQLNAQLYAYGKGLPDQEGGRVHLANGIWLNGAADLTVERDFLQTNADYYGAGLFEESFDEKTAEKINAWVAEHTAGRIDRIVDQLSQDAVMCLVNALSFDGQWEEIYREDQVRPGVFTTEDGQERDVEMMSSSELGYIQDGDAEGFVKYYEGRGYAFAALLPAVGVSVRDYVSSLTGGHLRELLTAVQSDVFVDAAIPKFTAEYATGLRDALGALGMPDAFDAASADFSRIDPAAEGLCISQVVHKTFIQVDEKGTQAGAATAVEIAKASLMGPAKAVTLDRPFLYMLIDCEHSVPLFLGMVTDIG